MLSIALGRKLADASNDCKQNGKEISHDRSRLNKQNKGENINRKVK